MSEFKKGDRIKVEYEGKVTYVSGHVIGLTRDDGGIHFTADRFATLIERPVEPLKPGTIVRTANGTVYAVHPDRVTFATRRGGIGRSGFTAHTLAEVMADHPDDYTILHEGTSK